MATGNTIIPINNSGEYIDEFLAWSKSDMGFLPQSLPQGRFPTLIELRKAIHDLGYKLEESHDWYVSSDIDLTEIWFREEFKDENKPIEFWCRRGQVIVLNIIQQLAHLCGGFAVINHSMALPIIIVPDSLFPDVSQLDKPSDFIRVISERMPIMIEQLDNASLETMLFLLSQIRQPLRALDFRINYELERSAQTGVSTYIKLLKHDDNRVRFMAFDLLTKFHDKFFQCAESLGIAITAERDSDTKAQMIWAIEDRIAYPNYKVRPNDIDQGTHALLNILLELCQNPTEASIVRFASVNILIRAQPGLLLPVIRDTFIDALVQPELYVTDWNSANSTIEQTLKSIELLLLHHRIEILSEALAKIPIAQDAHTVLRHLLDNAFFGQVTNTPMGSLPDDVMAERPEIGDTRFRENLSRNWKYPANQLHLTKEELLPLHTEVIERVIALDIPWMVHSNLLEKYGLPPTRDAVKALLSLKQ